MLVYAFNKGELSRKRNSRSRLLFVCTPATAYGGGQQYLYRILEAFDENEYNILFFHNSKILIDSIKKMHGVIGST